MKGLVTAAVALATLFLRAQAFLCSPPLIGGLRERSPGAVFATDEGQSPADGPSLASGAIELERNIKTLRKKKQFIYLPDDAIKVLPRSETRHLLAEEEDLVSINTIVLKTSSGSSAETILAILSEDDKIDMSKLREHWGDKVTTVDLAPADQLEALVGYAPGCIPPFGHKDASGIIAFSTIIDEKLIQNTARRKLLGGGGSEDAQSLVRLGAFVGMDHIEAVSISQDKLEDTNDDDNLPNLPPRTISLPPWGSSTRPKPLFPAETPDMAQVKSLLEETSGGDLPPSSNTTWVTLVGRIGGLRRMSKRLFFCNLLPPGYEEELESIEPPTNGEESPYAREWRGSDSEDMSVQLIGGKTLCQAMGEVQGQTALKRLKPGQWVLVQAKLNVFNSRDSLEQWQQHRRLDLVMVSYQFLYDKLPAQTLTPQVLLPPPSNSKPNKPFLCWQDLYGPNAADSDPLDYITLVDSMDAVQSFSKDISDLCLSLDPDNGCNQQIEKVNGSTNQTTDTFGKANKCSHAFVGMDCEWKPGFYLDTPNEQQPVLLLQISIHHRVYILDLQSLARPLQTVEEPMTPLEIEMNDAVSKIFSSKVLLKVGFQLVQDLQKLAVSYPHIPAFQEVYGVLEAATLATKVMRHKRQKNAMQVTASLNKLTEHFLNRSVKKEQQVSDWSQRPLTKEQLVYAALDAAITPALVQQFFDTLELSVAWPGPEVGRWRGDASYAKLLTSWKFLFLQPETDAQVVKKLKAKTILSNQPLMVVTQTWNTAEDAPKLPSVPVDDTDGPYTDVFGIVRVPSVTVPVRPPKQSREAQNTFVSSLTGQRTGKSKEKCLMALLSATLKDEPETMPEGARLEYPPRSGYVEFEDGLALFVNMPDKISESGGGIGQPRSYPNEWLEDGKALTWFLRDYEWLRGTTPLAKKLLDPDSLIVLFVRVTSKNFFLCCGPITVEEPEKKTDIVSKEKQERWYLVQLNLNVLEWEKLCQTEEFLSLVA